MAATRASRAKYDMTTFDDVLVKDSIDFMEKAKDSGKPFFLWHNTTRMHVFTFLSPKYKAMRNPKTNYGMEEAGMAQLDDNIGALMKRLRTSAIDDNTIVVFTTDNGAEVFTWPDGGMTPFRATKGTVYGGRLPRPGDHPLAGQGAAGQGRERHHLGARLVPDFRRRGRQPEHRRRAEERQGPRRHDLQGASRRLRPDATCSPARARRSAHEIWYFGETELGAVRLGDFKYRFIDQPGGWPGAKDPIDMPILATSGWIPSSARRSRTCSKVDRPT